MKRVSNALKKTVLAGATLHLSILFLLAVKTGEYDLINLFNVLHLEILYEKLGSGTPMFILSYVVVGGVFVYFYLQEKEQEKQK